MISYLVSTGTILKEYLEVRNVTQKELANETGYSEKHISNIISGKAKVTDEFAYKLEKVFPDVKAEFWLRIEGEYRLNLLRAEAKKKEFENLDLKTISKEYQFDYVFKGLNYSIEKKADEMLKLLGVNNFEVANESAVKQKQLVSFFHDGGNPKAQLVWIKLCENEFDIQNDIRSIKEFNKELLVNQLKTLKKIINTIDYEFMINNVRRFLNNFGIGLVIMEAVPTSLIRGAATVVDGIPAIFMSTRYKRLDSFYFTLFHEIKHIIEDDIYKGGYLEITYEKDEREILSHDFARKYLIDEKEFKEFLEKRNEIESKDIIAFANSQGVVVDIIIGFLERAMEHEFGTPIYGKFQNLRTKIE
ncbi:MAG: helix-turn-helix domain-containing protein [Acholeplasmatales bacterium]